MGRNKQIQIDEVKGFENVFSAYGDGEKPRGKWREDYFDTRDHLGLRRDLSVRTPLVLELGCGWGQYTLALARRFPERNFVGIDRKGDRIWVGAKEALGEEKRTGLPGKFCKDPDSESLPNAAFLQMEIHNLTDWFGPDEVDEIWVTFPDPQPKPCRAQQRLVSKRFLEHYSKVLKPGGVIHLKTDNADFFNYALEVCESEGCEILEIIRDVHGERKWENTDRVLPIPEILKVKTFYEKKFEAVGHKINYLKFHL